MGRRTMCDGSKHVVVASAAYIGLVIPLASCGKDRHETCLNRPEPDFAVQQG